MVGLLRVDALLKKTIGMGYAGLDIKLLAHALAKRRIEVEVMEDDRLWDHCLLRLRLMRYPHAQAWLCYENIGTEPRLATLWLGELPFDDIADVCRAGALGGHPSGGVQLPLAGPRREDAERIAGAD